MRTSRKMKLLTFLCLAIMSIAMLAFTACNKPDMSPQFKEETKFTLNETSVAALGNAPANAQFIFKPDGTYTEELWLSGNKIDAYCSSGTYELVKDDKGVITTIKTTNGDTDEVTENSVTKNDAGKYCFSHAGLAKLGTVIYYVQDAELTLPSAE